MVEEAASERDVSEDGMLDELLLLAIENYETGGEEAVSRLLRDHPAHATRLLQRIGGLRRVGLWDTGPIDPRIDLQDMRLGEFRLKRMLGAGGMGIVYLAEQESLGREVALKVVRPEYRLVAGTRERFKREVETVARLRHPGIVPIYVVGEHAGIPYFAMEHIDGETLERVLSRTSCREHAELVGRDMAPRAGAQDWLFEGTWEQACLRVTQQVAEALQHAHQCGVIHRDIKPSNIMLSSQGPSRAMLLDFGLAYSQEASTLTRSGTRLGSLPYMAPEQARGESARGDPRSDVYSLGAVLYELLTLERPFRGASDFETMQAVIDGKVRRPRTFVPTVSWEAETVCLKAMAVEPERRYRSAQDFARDLANALEGRPIEAQRASALLQVRRWGRRRPASAVAAVIGMGCAIVVPALSVWQANLRATDLQAFNRRLQEQLLETSAAKAQADTQGQRAQRAAVRARNAIRSFLGKVGDEYLESIPRSDELRTQLLEDAAQLYEGMLEDDPDNADVEAEVGLSLRMLGERYHAVARIDEGDDCLERSVEHLRRAAHLQPDEVRWKQFLGKTLGERAVVRVERGTWDADTKAWAEEARSLLETCFELDPGNQELRQDLASVLNVLGNIVQLGGEGQAELALYRRAEEIALAGAVGNLALRSVLMYVRINIASSHNDAGQLAEAIEAYQRARETVQGLLQDDPVNVEVRYVGAALELNLSGALEKLGRLDESLVHAQAARGQFEGLLRDFPARVLFAREACVAGLSTWQLSDRSTPEADDAASQVCRRLQGVLERTPDDHRARSMLMIQQHAFGGELLARDDFVGACEQWRAALVVASEVAGDPQAHLERGCTVELLKDVLAARTRSPECRDLAQEFASILRQKYPGDSLVDDELRRAELE